MACLGAAPPIIGLTLPLFGGISVLVFERMADRIAGGKRRIAMLAGLVPLVAVMALMRSMKDLSNVISPLVLVSAAAVNQSGTIGSLARESANYGHCKT